MRNGPSPHERNERLQSTSDQKCRTKTKKSITLFSGMSRPGGMGGRGGGGGAPIILSVAEKPSVARELAAIIGGGTANRVIIILAGLDYLYFIYFTLK